MKRNKRREFVMNEREAKTISKIGTINCINIRNIFTTDNIPNKLESLHIF